MSFDGKDDNCWNPDAPVERSDNWRLRVTQFGDGYQQRVLDGINNYEQRWNLTFGTRPQKVINEMVAYLLAQKAKSFDFYEDQTALTYRVFCDEWTVTWDFKRFGKKGYGWYGTLTAEFKRAYGITA